jgi:hypothetical protein
MRRALFTLALEALEAQLTEARTSPHGFVWPAFPLPGQPNLYEDCLVMVKNTLAKCPDEALSKSTKGLTFISDKATREAILVDLGSAESALHNGEWKAATVLSGSVIEAILYGELKQKDPN